MLKQTTYYETINPQVLDEAIKASSNDADFGKSMERIAKLSAQIIDIANSLYYFSSNYCNFGFMVYLCAEKTCCDGRKYQQRNGPDWCSAVLPF